MVASKEVKHQAPLTLPTSVGSAEMKNYRKEKKGRVTCVREIDGLRNNGHAAGGTNPSNPPQRCRWLINKKAHSPSMRISST